ncbi:MAG: hypothetical protein V1848_00605 [Candidatus Magasanikbacteria bacterium]
MPEEKKNNTEKLKSNTDEKFIEDYIEKIYNANEAYGDYAHLETMDEKVARLKNLRKETIGGRKNLPEVSLNIQAIDKAIEMAKEQQKEEKTKTKESKKKFGIGFSGFFNRKSEKEITEAEERKTQGKEVRLEEMAKGNRWERESLRLEQEAYDERKEHEAKLKELIAQLELIEKGDPQLKDLVAKAKKNLHELENINTTHHELIIRGQNNTRTNLLAEIKKLQNYVKGELPDLTEDAVEETDEGYNGGPRFWNKEGEVKQTSRTEQKSTPPPMPDEKKDVVVPEKFTEEEENWFDEGERIGENTSESMTPFTEYYDKFTKGEAIELPPKNAVQSTELAKVIKKLQEEEKTSLIFDMIRKTYDGFNPDVKNFWLQFGADKILKQIEEDRFSAQLGEKNITTPPTDEEIEDFYVNMQHQQRKKQILREAIKNDDATLYIPDDKAEQEALRAVINEAEKNKDTKAGKIFYTQLVNAIDRGYDRTDIGEKAIWNSLGAGHIIKNLLSKEFEIENVDTSDENDAKKITEEDAEKRIVLPVTRTLVYDKKHLSQS